MERSRSMIFIPGQGFGPKGDNGKTLRSGSGVPSSSLGVEGDFYINTAASTIYGPKTSGSWGSPTSLVGSPGSNGLPGSNGSNGLDALHCGLRLTSVSATPILTTTQLAKTTLYDTPFLSSYLSLYNSSIWVATSVPETSLSTSGFTASRMHDIYGYLNGSTYTLEAVAWSNNTTPPTRGTQNGIVVKNGDATKRFRGVVYVNANKEIEWHIGGIGAGGTEAKAMIWNENNRVPFRFTTGDNANSWTHTNDSAWAAPTTMKFSFALGRTMEQLSAVATNRPTATTGVNGAIAIGLDSTTAYATNCLVPYTNSASSGTQLTSQWSGYVTPGLHFLQYIDYSTGGSTVFFGDNGLTYMQTGTTFEGWF